ncbi:hypothetical protein BD779DRAFT_254556 [Infundibulicybe gibba]|nr:hypothetical protein BD779DRAFT_254556 [Infundibulicybe gibba]
MRILTSYAECKFFGVSLSATYHDIDSSGRGYWTRKTQLPLKLSWFLQLFPIAAESAGLTGPQRRAHHRLGRIAQGWIMICLQHDVVTVLRSRDALDRILQPQALAPPAPAESIESALHFSQARININHEFPGVVGLKKNNQRIDGGAIIPNHKGDNAHVIDSIG